VGTAYCIHEIFVNRATRRLAADEVRPELARYEKARDGRRSRSPLALYKSGQPGGQVGSRHLSGPRVDSPRPRVQRKIRHWIVERHQTAPYALDQVLQEYTSLFARTKDQYLRERLTDVRDVIVRISGHLSDVLAPKADGILPDPWCLWPMNYCPLMSCFSARARCRALPRRRAGRRAMPRSSPAAAVCPLFPESAAS